MVRSLALSFAVLLAVFETGFCLKCFQCNSASNPECRDPFAATNKVSVDCRFQDTLNYNKQYLRFMLPAAMIETTTGNFYCAKIVGRDGLVARTCLNGPAANDPNYQCKTYGSNFKECSFCKEDNCNGSNAISASVPVALLALAATYLFCKQ